MSNETSSQVPDDEVQKTDDVNEPLDTDEVPESKETVESGPAAEASESDDAASDAPSADKPPVKSKPKAKAASKPPKKSRPKAGGIEENDRLMAALAYFLWFIGSAIILLSADMKERPYLRYHAIQALGLSAVLAVASFILIVLSFVFCCIGVLLLVPLAITLYYTYQAYQGEYFKVPVISNAMAGEGWLEEK